MAHIHQNAQVLGIADIFSSQVRQPLPGLVGAGEHIAFIPAQGGNAKARLEHRLQKLRIKVKARRTLNGQKGRHFALFIICPNVIGAVDQTNLLFILVDLPLDGGDLPFKNHHGRQAIPLFILHIGGRETGKALAIAGQFFRPGQINMSFILNQAAPLIHIFAQQPQSGIAVQVKYRKTHSNASSK